MNKPAGLNDANSTWLYFKFSPNYEYQFFKNISLAAGPSISLIHTKDYFLETTSDFVSGTGKIKSSSINTWYFGAYASIKINIPIFIEYKTLISLDYDTNFFYAYKEHTVGEELGWLDFFVLNLIWEF